MVAEQLFPPVRAKIDIPQAWSTITGYQFFDPFFGWTIGPNALNVDWNITTGTTRTIQGQPVLYDRYEKAGGIGGPAQYRFLT